jgi:hypothetical protein
MADVDQSICEKALLLVVDILERTATFKISSEETLVLNSSNDDANSNQVECQKSYENMQAEHSNEEEEHDGGLDLSFFIWQHFCYSCSFFLFSITILLLL